MAKEKKICRSCGFEYEGKEICFCPSCGMEMDQIKDLNPEEVMTLRNKIQKFEAKRS